MTNHTDIFMAAEKVAPAIGAFTGQKVIERVRESEYATEADLVEFASVLLDGRYREQKEGAFARLFERMLNEGGGIIPETVAAAEKSAAERRKEAQEKREDAAKKFTTDPIETFRQLFGEDFFDVFGTFGESIFDDDGESTP